MTYEVVAHLNKEDLFKMVDKEYSKEACECILRLASEWEFTITPKELSMSFVEMTEEEVAEELGVDVDEVHEVAHEYDGWYLLDNDYYLLWQ